MLGTALLRRVQMRLPSSLMMARRPVVRLYSSGAQWRRPNGWGTPAGQGFVVGGLIAANALVFMRWQLVETQKEQRYMVDNFTCSAASAASRPWTLATSVFSHNLPMHFAVNMLVLYSFGPLTIRAIGVQRFLALYFMGGLVSNIAHVAYSRYSGGDRPAHGASGAINSLIVAFACMFPKSEFLVMGFIPVRAPIAVGLFALYDFFFLGDRSIIGHAAHLGGFAFGILYYVLRLRVR
ncbi:Peptidase S54 rhomboid domain-containing protein [Plasmodiophora brassicae]